MIKNWLMKPIAYWLTRSVVPAKRHLSDFSSICEQIQPADVLLIEGRNRVSAFIQSMTQSAWSHAVIYLGTVQDIEDSTTLALVKKHYQGSPRTPLIVESQLGYGTIIRPLAVYDHEHIRICRPRGLKGDDAHKVLQSVCNELGKPYHINHILVLLLFLCPYRLIPRRLMSRLFNHVAKKQYGSDLLCNYRKSL